MINSELLLGNQIRLTALNADDAATLARWQQNSEFLRLYDSRPAYPKTEAQLRDMLKKLEQDQNTFSFAIRLLQGEEMIGYLELDGIEWQHGVCGMSLGIGDKMHWGQGFGYAAAQLGLTFAFSELNLHRVTATVFAYNQRSLALFKKLGFCHEGTFREFLQRDGQRHNMHLYGLLRHEWKQE